MTEYNISKVISIEFDIITNTIFVLFRWENERYKEGEVSYQNINTFLSKDGTANVQLIQYLDLQKIAIVYQEDEISDDMVDVSFYGYFSIHRLPISQLKSFMGTSKLRIVTLQPDHSNSADTRIGNITSEWLYQLASPKIQVTWLQVINGCLCLTEESFTKSFLDRFFVKTQTNRIVSNTIATFDLFTTNDDATLAQEMFHFFLVSVYLLYGRINILNPKHTYPESSCTLNQIRNVYEFQPPEWQNKYLTWLRGLGYHLFGMQGTEHPVLLNILSF